MNYILLSNIEIQLKEYNVNNIYIINNDLAHATYSYMK